MTDQLTLVADVGGTNTRFALANANGILAETAVRYANENIENFQTAAQSYLASLEGPRPLRLCGAIAGPVSQGMGKLTNGDWEFSQGELSQSLGLHDVHLMNDLVALGHALEVLPQTIMQQIGGKAPIGTQALVAGIATGFNVGLSHNGNVIAAEIGHASLPNSVMQILEKAIGSKAQAFTSVEMLFSGQGLSLLHRSLGFGNEKPAIISENAGDSVMLFAHALGAYCRELSFIYMPMAGIYLNGSVVRAILTHEVGKEIVASYCANDKSFGGQISQMPIYLITADNAALYGCARYVYGARP